MATKLQVITELSESTVKNIIREPSGWASFLHTAAWNYKYPFQDQVLIYAQRPDATACAPIELWNRRLNRWVNKGAKGIALINDDGNRHTLHHLFDVSDTHSHGNHPINLWAMQDRYEDAVTEALENTFGELENRSNLPDALINTVQNAVDDNIPDYLSNLMESLENSYLEELDEQNIGVFFRDTLISSVAYMALVRCGYNPDDYLNQDDFRHLFNFNTLETISHLGAATSDISEMVLRDIETTVKDIYWEEKKQTCTFAKKTGLGQNETENDYERDGEHGTDIFAEGRLPDTRPDTAGGRQTYRQVWDVAQNIPKKSQERGIRKPNDVGQANEPSRGDRPNSKGTRRADHGTASGNEPRAGQSDTADGLGGTHEQPEASGGGNGDKRPDLQLEWHNRETEDKSLPFFHSSERINEILRTTPHLKATKQEIIDFYDSHTDKKERTDYIKSIFNNDYTEILLGEDNQRVGYKTYQNVLHLWEGSYNDKTSQSYYDWGAIAGHFDSMILLNEFLNDPPGLPSEQYQIAMIEQAEEEKSSAFLIPQESIDAVLQLGSGVQAGKYRIYIQFLKNASPKENADFLKNEYGIGGQYPALTGTNIDEWHDGKGITISRGSIANPNTKIFLSWAKVQKRIGELIAANRYLNSREIEHLPAYEKEIEERSQELAEQAYARDILNREPTGAEQVSQVETGYTLSLGDTVYIGANEYELNSYDEGSVELRDMLFPLLTKKFPRTDFDRMLRENSLNNHLSTKKGPPLPHVEKEKKPSAQHLYHTYLPELVNRIRQDSIYPYLRDRDAETESVEQELSEALDRIALSMQEEHPAFFEAYTSLPQFRDWLIEDIFQQTYEDYLTESEDSVTIHIDDPDAPDWVRETGDITITRKGDTVTIEDRDENDSEKSYVEFDVELPDKQKEEKQRQVRINFHITDNNLGAGGQKTKYAWNIEAIRLLNQLEEENRLATPEEQEILSRYVGWGGIPQAFDENNASWAKEYTELKELLNEDEYASARASTLNAHYTSPTVIKAIYTCLENMGFRTGNILEPACGIGNFFGLVPERMSDSKLYGVELDGITGRIAKQLYQNVSIAVQGFEETSLPDSFFDLAIGNVPFGDYGVIDKKYDKHKFLIHDYFFAKTLDKVRPGGIIAFITSKGTMDKQNPEVRRYIAQRTELLGAVRLPNNAFLANAGTEVTADILFLQKRDRIIDIEPEWVHLSTTDDGIPVNQYFSDNPDMVLGTMTYDDRMYGKGNETTCIPYEDTDLSELLHEELENIHAEITEYEFDDITEDEDTSIPAEPNVRNFSFCLVDGQIYYRENSRMNPVETSITAKGRIKGMIELRDCVRDLIEYQTEDYSEAVIKEQQEKLNRLYDNFTAKYGLINSRGNSMAFDEDSAYCLLCSLEVLDENGEMERKADMFSKRTIRQRAIVTHVDTAVEALAISIAEKAHVNMGYMHTLTGLSEEQLAADLQGMIFRDFGNMETENVSGAFDVEAFPYVPADEYLSGNVRVKLKQVRAIAEIISPEQANTIQTNIKALEAVQPRDLDASEIDVRLGATWLLPDVIKDFMFELLETPRMYQQYIDVFYSNYTANWNIKGKNDDRSDNVKANVTYGTSRINAYKIIEETLNLKDVRIFDTVYENGNETRVLNKKETAIAQQKQEAIKEAFKNWIWKEPERRERLTRIYNDRFNSIRPREYDGSNIRFTGMNPEITMRKHQVDAVAHHLYGGNTLLAHCVGAGKTYEMAASAMESKHLGLCQKSLFVVPNHLTEQWAGEFLQLYPSANILVATKKDFQTKNRKKFCARIATGEYDAIIIGHSQFEKIPISQERQKRQLELQIWEITSGIQELKSERSERYAIKQLEKTKKKLEIRLKRLNDTSRKDDVVTFEELGVDRLFVDEADFYKNLFLYTKMRNVAGLAQTEAQKSSDLFSKCRYLDELTEGRGIVFGTGTPISNSITEMYTMQRYLQYETLKQNGLQHFDCWASTFGETVTAIELAPEGTGYRAKTRFARFYNLPELMSMFKEVADIKTADMLNLPVPEANYHNVSVKPSDFQKDMVAELAERAEKVRNRMVEPYEDNMLKITNDGRKLALDQRLANDMLPDNESSKVNACVDNIFRLWHDNNNKKLTQLVFCDQSTPKGDGQFNVYEDIRQKLVAQGVPRNEVAFIHEANTETRKKELFAKVRKGQVRILMGSTFKMGVRP